MESRMYRSAMKGKPDILNEYTDQCALKFTPNNNTVLHVIAEFGHSRCVAGILNECPFLVRRENTTLDTPIHIAVAGGRYHVVKSLVNFAKSNNPCAKVVREMLRVRNPDGDSPLHLAARCRNPIGIVRLLTTEDPEFDHRPSKAAETPLYMIVVRGSDIAVVSQILKNCKTPSVLEKL